MDFLPFEILSIIFKEVDDVRDLRTLRSASRTLCAAATPIAFRFLSVITTRTSAQNLGHLFDVPHIAAHIKEVSFRDTGADRRGGTQKCGASSTTHPVIDISVNLPWRVMPVRTSTIRELESLFSRVHQLPRLETINLMFYGKWLNPDGEGRLALQESILGALATSFSVRAPATLTSLSLHNLYPAFLSPLDSPSFQTALTTLQNLQLFPVLNGTFGLDMPLDHWCHFWGTICPRIFLAPTQHFLTKLTLHSNVYVGASSGLSLRELHFPHLCALSLCNLVFDRSVGAEYFVLRHALTITRLELLMCKLPIDRRGQLLPVFLQGPTMSLARDDESSPGLGHWNSIWDRFADELTALVVLRVDERRRGPCGGAILVRRYVDIGPSLSYWEIDVPEPRNVADAEALQRFQMTVATRSEEMYGKS